MEFWAIMLNNGKNVVAVTRFYFTFTLNGLKENFKKQKFLSLENFTDKDDAEHKGLPETDGNEFKI